LYFSPYPGEYGELQLNAKILKSAGKRRWGQALEVAQKLASF